MTARALWLVIGFVATGLGVAGAVLPILPATPFLLVAAYAFARSSPRLYDWLVTHPWLGPPINDWRAYGAINRRAKVLAMVVMVVTLAASIAGGISAPVILVQAALMSGAALFILTRPDGPDSES